MKIIPLVEGSFTVDGSKQFIPFIPGQDAMEDRPKGSLLVEVVPFLVITANDIILLDTGLGFAAEDGQLQLIKNLAAAGINATDITKVLMSHLHKDHAGGLLHHGALLFPNATYYLQQREFDFALEGGSASYKAEQFEALKNFDNLVLLTEDKGQINDQVSYELTQAHSRFHQVFWIKEAGETILFGADDAPQLLQMKHRFAAKYDYDGKKAMALRSTWWQQGEAENWTFLFYHDVKTPVFQF